MKMWISLFSHTGAEVEAVSERLGRTPDIVLTNNMDYAGTLDVIKADADVINYILTTCAIDAVVTLNGYMRIIPADVLNILHQNGCIVLNVHPAPITVYPELKGRDPQIKLHEGIQSGLYNKIGVVIHEVDEGVDTGAPVAVCCAQANAGETLEAMNARLHKYATFLWTKYFERTGVLDG